MDIVLKNLNETLTQLANTIYALGKEQQRWERSQIKFKRGVSPYNKFLFYVALAAIWQAFSVEISGQRRLDLSLALHDALQQLTPGQDTRGNFKDILRKYRSSRHMAAVYLLEFWARLKCHFEQEGFKFENPTFIMKQAEAMAKRRQHWLVYAPLEAAIVVGDLWPCPPEIVPPLGNRVMAGFNRLGLHFQYPPSKREVIVIHEFLKFLAHLCPKNPNHLLMEMGIWKLGGL